MAKDTPKDTQAHGSAGQKPVGVWNRGAGRGPANPIRVRTKRLDEISGDKIALAYWLLAKQIVADGTDQPLDEDAVRRYAESMDDHADGAGQ